MGGFNGMTSAIPVRCSTNWAMKPRRSRVELINLLPVIRREWEWCISYTRNLQIARCSYVCISYARAKYCCEDQAFAVNLAQIISGQSSFPNFSLQPLLRHCFVHAKWSTLAWLVCIKVARNTLLGARSDLAQIVLHFENLWLRKIQLPRKQRFWHKNLTKIWQKLSRHSKHTYSFHVFLS